MKRGILRRIFTAALAASVIATSVGSSQLVVYAEEPAAVKEKTGQQTEVVEEEIESTVVLGATKSVESTEETEETEKIEVDEDLKAADSENLFVDGDLGDDDTDDLWGSNPVWYFTDSDVTWYDYVNIDYSADAANNTNKGLGIYYKQEGSIRILQTIESLEKGSYTITGYIKETNNVNSSIQGHFGDEDDKEENAHSVDTSFSQFEFHFTLSEPQTNYKVGFLITAESGAWVCLDTLTLTKDASEDEQKTQAVTGLKTLIDECKALNESAYKAEGYAALQTAIEAAETVYKDAANKTLDEIKAATTALQKAKDALIPASVVDAGVFTDKLDLSEDFIKGVDISSYVSITESGAVFRNWEGEVIDDAGFFTLLKDAGVNWVRIRVWNNPYDANGNGYGGGNNDIEKAGVLGKLATDAGLKVLIDFHYSDFWADPAMQAAPKAWKNMSVDEKATAVEKFTKSSLDYLHKLGVDVRMVQIGNETNNGICGETEWENRAKIFNAGAAGVRAYEDEVYGSSIEDGSKVMVAVHFTEPNTGIQATIASNLDKYNVDYDVFATSYYPFWHGTLENLNSVLDSIATTYGKKVMVAETSYAYTYKDGDGHENNVRAGNANTLDLDYNISLQGQVDSVSSVMKTVNNTTNGIGMFYWEPAWIPVQEYDADAANAEAVLASNKEKWERYGSGWAASYSAEYDPENAGRYYGGSSWDNQALFDHSGKPLESLNVFKYVNTGSTTTVRPDVVKSTSLVFVQGETYTMPSTVTVVNNDGTTTEAEVTWDAAQVAALGAIGSSTINGTAAGLDAICNVEILPVNSLVNGDFEAGLGDGNGWTINGDDNGLIKIATSDVKRGSKA